MRRRNRRVPFLTSWPQRIAEGEIVLKHVRDEHMPADFLTKWIPKDKLKTSLLYATGNTPSR